MKRLKNNSSNIWKNEMKKSFVKIDNNELFQMKENNKQILKNYIILLI